MMNKKFELEFLLDTELGEWRGALELVKQSANRWDDEYEAKKLVEYEYTIILVLTPV